MIRTKVTRTASIIYSAQDFFSVIFIYAVQKLHRRSITILVLVPKSLSRPA
jgi:hypothetical protein